MVLVTRSNDSRLVEFLQSKWIIYLCSFSNPLKFEKLKRVINKKYVNFNHGHASSSPTLRAADPRRV